MHALITGGAGFIGSHLADALLARGDTVTVIDDLSTGRLSNIAHLENNSNFHSWAGNVKNVDAMTRLVHERCDIVFHLAAVVGVDKVVKNPLATMMTNMYGTDVVLSTAARYGVKVVIASTSEVYGKSDALPFREDGDRVMGPTTKSRWCYAESKAIDEFMALAYHAQYKLPVVICRFFNTVGPRQSGNYGMVIPRLVRQALAGQSLTVYGDGSQTRCFCNVRDTVRAVMALADAPRAVGEIYNVGSMEEVSILGLAQRIAIKALPPSGAGVEMVPYSQAYAPGFEEMQRRVPCLDKIKAAIGWEPEITLDQTLGEVIEYEKGQA